MSSLSAAEAHEVQAVGEAAHEILFACSHCRGIVKAGIEEEVVPGLVIPQRLGVLGPKLGILVPGALEVDPEGLGAGPLLAAGEEQDGDE